MGCIDFRSDTLTKPSAAMRKRMAEAEVGDDFYREDPTVRALEQEAASLLGTEACLFVLSGTMGNLAAIRSQIPAGAAAIVSATSHIHLNEAGHLAGVCGITSYSIPTPSGRYALAALEAAVPTPVGPSRGSVLTPQMKAICVENTHNGEGGRCLDGRYLARLRSFADARGMVVHMDGARLFNAAVALSCPPADLVAHVDSVSVCLSKGLGAPGGAIIGARRDLIEEARFWRQAVGGGMRQAGILAAAGLMALQENVGTLAEDHANARLLATGLQAAGLEVDLGAVETNIVMAYVPERLGDPKVFHERLGHAGVLTLPPKANRLRFVTYRDLVAADITLAVERMARVVEALDRRVRHV